MRMKNIMERKHISRRQFLQLWRVSKQTGSSSAAADLPVAPMDTGKPATLKIPIQPLPPITSALSPPRTAFVLRPPGAIAEADFIEQCQSCGNCINNCPVQAIDATPAKNQAWTPTINPATNPCVLCADLKCTHSCPSGALQPLFTANAVRMGTAQINTVSCTAWRGLPCRICYDVCPIPGVIELERGERSFVPSAGENPCVGCGLCLHHCPAPGAIEITPYIAEHAGHIHLQTCQSGKYVE